MRKEFRTAWLLLLLNGGSSYGYELRRELADRELEVDPAVMYRSLREMERANLICSRWMRSDAGPKRRVYTITGEGRAELARAVAAITVARDSETMFLRAYECSTARS